MRSKCRRFSSLCRLLAGIGSGDPEDIPEESFQACLTHFDASPHVPSAHPEASDHARDTQPDVLSHACPNQPPIESQTDFFCSSSAIAEARIKHRASNRMTNRFIIRASRLSCYFLTVFSRQLRQGCPCSPSSNQAASPSWKRGNGGIAYTPSIAP